MSLYYVNEHLIHEEVTDDKSWPNGENYKRIMIRTTDQLVKANEDGEVQNFSKPICAHNCSLNPTSNTRISSTYTEGETKRNARVTVRTSSDTRYNSDIFIVALPYEGMVQPFTHDEEALQIYKSLIVKSDRFTIENGDKKYRRCAYFIVKPNHTHLGNDGWYDKACNLKLTFARSDRPKKSDSVTKWIFTTTTVRFGADGKFEINEDVTEGDADSFDPESIRSAPICRIVEPTALAPRDAQQGGNFANRNGGNRQDTNGGGGRRVIDRSNYRNNSRRH